MYVALAVDTFSHRIVGWSVATSEQTSLELGALEMGLWQCDHAVQDQRGLLDHSDAGQYASFRLAIHLHLERIAAGIGLVGGAYDDALTDIEIAAGKWVDWYNGTRFYGEIGHIPLAKCKGLYYAKNQLASQFTATT